MPRDADTTPEESIRRAYGYWESEYAVGDAERREFQAECDWAIEALRAEVPAGKVAVEVEDVKALLDIATQSMDFGSGFLDDEEVETMRRIAAQVGVDPINVTPSSFTGKYFHSYRPSSPTTPRCYYCGRESGTAWLHEEAR